MKNLKECLENLNCPDEAERIYAAEDIGYLNVPEGVPVLLNRLNEEPSRAVRDAIFQSLIRIEADAAISGPIQLLGSDEPHLRNQAVQVLRHKGSASIPFLAAVMQDGDKDKRKLVLDVLSGVQAGDAKEIYMAALSDEDPNVVITAVENLGKIRAVEFRSRIEMLLQSDSHPMLIAACLETLVCIGHESSLAAIRRVFPDLTKAPDFLLAPCLKAIAVLGMESQFDEVASLLLVRDANLHSAILSALIGIHTRCPSYEPDENLLLALRAMIENEKAPLCCYQALRIIGFCAARDDLYAFLISCLSSKERLVRLGAAESIRMASRYEADLNLALRILEESDEALQGLSNVTGTQC
jgi:HEAT repeat protein